MRRNSSSNGRGRYDLLQTGSFTRRCALQTQSHVEKIYGLPLGGLPEDEQIQELASVVTKEGRLLAFLHVL